MGHKPQFDVALDVASVAMPADEIVPLEYLVQAALTKKYIAIVLLFFSPVIPCRSVVRFEDLQLQAVSRGNSVLRSST